MNRYGYPYEQPALVPRGSDTRGPTVHSYHSHMKGTVLSTYNEITGMNLMETKFITSVVVHEMCVIFAHIIKTVRVQ